MATLISEWSNVEVRAVIRFLHAKGIGPSEILKELVSVYGEGVMSRKQVSVWCKAFSDGRTSVEDEPRSGRPCTSSGADQVNRVDALIRQDRRYKVRDLALELDISKSVVHEIVQKLGYRKVSARWVPKQLTDVHKEQRRVMSAQLLDRFRFRHAELENVITGDETWVHHVTPETKRDSMTWKHAGSPVARKFKVQNSARKMMATVFWDSKGVLLVHFTPHGETVNAANYCETLNLLREAIRRKRPSRLRQGVLLQHDDATPHTAHLTRGWLEKYGWEILPHPPHSPDLAPSDFHLFGNLMRRLSGCRFENDEGVADEVRGWLNTRDEQFYRDGIFALLHRWQKCIDNNGDYIEK